MRARLNRNGRCNIASSLAVQQPRLPLPGDVPPFVGSKPLRPSIVEGVWHTRIKVTFGESGAVVEQPTANVNGIVCMSASRVHARTPDSSRLVREREREGEAATHSPCLQVTSASCTLCIDTSSKAHTLSDVQPRLVLFRSGSTLIQKSRRTSRTSRTSRTYR